MIKYLLAHTDIWGVRLLLSFMADVHVFLCTIKVKLGRVQCSHAHYQQEMPLDKDILSCKSREEFNLLLKKMPKLCLVCKTLFKK